MFKDGDVVTETIPVTAKMVQLFAEASGDFNAMHMDDEYAKKTRFGKRIAHGMLAGSLISRVMAMKLGPGGIYLSQSMKFINPVFIDDVVTVTLTVKNLRDSGVASIETNVSNQRGEMVVKGEAVIMRADKV